MDRRSVLSLVAGAGVATIAGCGSSEDSGLDDGTDDTGGPTNGTAAPTADPVPGGREDCSISNATDSVDRTPVSVDGRLEGATAVVALRWNARAQKSIKDDPDDYIGSEADSGNKYVIFRLEVTNTATGVVTVDEYNFELAYETPDTVGTASSAINGIDEIDYNIKAGGTVSGILTFIVPADATVATLQPRVPNFAGREPIAFEPACDRTLSMDAPTLNDESA